MCGAHIGGSASVVIAFSSTSTTGGTGPVDGDPLCVLEVGEWK